MAGAGPLDSSCVRCSRQMLALAIAAAAALSGCGESASKTPGATTSTASSSTGAPAPPAAGGGAVTGAAVGAARTVSASTMGVTATMHAGTHAPLVGRAWPVHFIVTSAGRPAPASVAYEYLLGAAVVARRSHYTFHGRFSDVFYWPASAVGYPLTFRAVIVSGPAHIDLDYTVQVAR